MADPGPNRDIRHPGAEASDPGGGPGREGPSAPSHPVEGDSAPASPPIREFFPYLCIRGAGEAIDFYRRLFNVTEGLRMDTDDGRVAHAELMFGSTLVMVSDEYPDLGIRGPAHWGGTPVRFHLHVNRVDDLAQRAAAEGAVILRSPRNEDHGERQCLLRDPWGHEWLLGGPP